MEGNEIITVHFGPYANFVGAFLANNEYRQTFGTSFPVTVGTGEGTSYGGSTTNPAIFFTSNKRSRSKNAADNAYYIPRAIYCDYDGAIPVQHASLISSQKIQQSQQLDLDNNDFLSYLSHPYFSPKNVTKPSRESSEEPLDLAQINEEHLYWHNILYPQLRPMTNCPENVILTLSNHVMGIQHDIFTQATTIAKHAVSPTSSSHEDTFFETLINQFRIISEQCDYLQGVRILVDITSIWGGVCYQFLQHLMEDYKSLNIMIIAVSTPLSIDNYNSAMQNELYSYQIYNNIPYSPFSTSLTQCTSNNIKLQTVTTRDKRLYNQAIFTSYVKQFDNIILIPITIPLTNTLVKVMNMSIPTLLHKFNNKYITHKDDNGKSEDQVYLNNETKLLLYSLYKSLPSILYYYITSSYIALSLYQICLPLYYLDVSEDGGKSQQQTVMLSLSQLARTIRPTPSLFLSTLLHQQQHNLFSSLIFGGNDDLQRNTGPEFNSFFPIVSLQNGELYFNVISNLFPKQHQNQGLRSIALMDKEKESANLPSAGSTMTGHNTYNISHHKYNDIFDKGSPDENVATTPNSSIDIYTSYTLLNYDHASRMESIQHHSLNGVSLSSTNNALQYQYECRNKYKKMLYNIYALTNNNHSATNQSLLYNIPHNLLRNTTIPSANFNDQNLTNLLFSQSSTADILDIFNLRPLSSRHNGETYLNQNFPDCEALSSLFISPQLSTSFSLLSAMIRPINGTSSLPTTRYMTKNLYDDNIEQDDWDEIYNDLYHSSIDYDDIKRFDL